MRTNQNGMQRVFRVFPYKISAERLTLRYKSPGDVGLPNLVENRKNLEACLGLDPLRIVKKYFLEQCCIELLGN